MRRFALTVATVLLVMPIGSVARAGGAVWEFEGYHRPGDHVESTTAVQWDHNSMLGTPEDGPFLVYLAPNQLAPQAWPGIPDEALLVGVVEVRTGPYISDGMSMGPHHAVARFEIPDVPAGSYQILHCNDPCTTTLGDIVGGWDLRVLSGADGRSPAAIAAEVRATVPSLPLLFENDLEPALADEKSRVTTIRVTALLDGQLVAL
jgi:hypothetical protein